MDEPFIVKDCALIALATGEYVQTLRELRIAEDNIDQQYLLPLLGWPLKAEF